MPNPKSGCVVPPNANLKPLYEKLQKTVKIQTKNDPIIQTIVGNESMKDEEIVDNIMTVYDALVNQLPSGRDNIRNVFIKLTMGKSFEVGKEETVKEEKSKEQKKEEKKITLKEENKPEVKETAKTKEKKEKPKKESKKEPKK